MGPDRLWLVLLLTALLLSPLYLMFKSAQAANAEFAARQKRSHAVASRVATLLGLALSPGEDPYRRGGWTLAGELDGVLVRLWYHGPNAQLSLLAGDDDAEPWDLCRAEAFARGGLENPEDDPYEKLPREALGAEGFFVRGARAREALAALPEPARDALRDDPTLAVEQGWLTCSWTAEPGDERATAAALAAWTRDRAALLRRAPEAPADEPGAPPSGDAA